MAQQSLTMLQAVEEDRKTVSQMSPWVRQEGSLVKDAGEKIRWWTTSRAPRGLARGCVSGVLGRRFTARWRSRA